MVRQKGLLGVFWILEQNFSAEDADKAEAAAGASVSTEAQAELIRSVAARIAELEEAGE